MLTKFSTTLSMMVFLLHAAQMLRRDLNAVASNATETAAWGKLWAKQSARGRRTPLEIAKEQEKYGKDCQRPCALCEQVRIVTAVLQ
jgi:hypothetical protein